MKGLLVNDVIFEERGEISIAEVSEIALVYLHGTVILEVADVIVGDDRIPVKRTGADETGISYPSVFSEEEPGIPDVEDFDKSGDESCHA
jgi:hypothetical protein